MATNTREAGEEEGSGKGGKSNGYGKEEGNGKEDNGGIFFFILRFLIPLSQYRVFFCTLRRKVNPSIWLSHPCTLVVS